MPIMDRKYFIYKHNEYVKQENENYKNNNGAKENNIDGIGINTYAKMEQQKKGTN